MFLSGNSLTLIAGSKARTPHLRSVEVRVCVWIVLALFGTLITACGSAGSVAKTAVLYVDDVALKFVPYADDVALKFVPYVDDIPLKVMPYMDDAGRAFVPYADEATHTLVPIVDDAARTVVPFVDDLGNVVHVDADRVAKSLLAVSVSEELEQTGLRFRAFSLSDSNQEILLEALVRSSCQYVTAAMQGYYMNPEEVAGSFVPSLFELGLGDLGNEFGKLVVEVGDDLRAGPFASWPLENIRSNCP